MTWLHKLGVGSIQALAYSDVGCHDILILRMISNLESEFRSVTKLGNSEISTITGQFDGWSAVQCSSLS